jgi:signal transduction histidine kinase
MYLCESTSLEQRRSKAPLLGGICVAKALYPSGSPHALYVPQSCVEHLIAAGQPVLATFSLLALWLDPSKPARYAHIASIFLAVYGRYALLVALVVWCAEAPLVGLRYGTHAADVLISTVFMYFTEDPTSPFFLAVIFVLFCAMFYWQWRGIVWTAVAVLIICLGLGIYTVGVLHEAAFALHTFVIHGIYIVAVAILLRYLNAYHQHFYGDMAIWRLEQDALLQQVQQAAVAAERLHLARNLRDGVLQSLTGAALHLETIPRLLEQEPLKAREHLRDSQQLLVAEQQDLRCLIQALRPSPAALAEPPFVLAPHLERLGQRLERLWGPRVDMRLEGLDRALPGALSQDLYLMIHEALLNAVWHAGASSVCVALSVQDTSVHLIVRDNGRGFLFHRHYDLAALTALSLGPRMLRERMMSLGGDLTIDSTGTEACLSITVPLGRLGAQECQFAS